ncbi:MAG: 3-phosphoglycerate dehydrogenase [Clostridia bacterium]|nr:3-phosphoglycerate dehydrogenase [Clostridia bacterium]NLS85830.1 phosphoglycerate dehydrogenase [Oscillospiraceae bacterium]
MYNIKTLNSISPKGLERLSSNLFAVDAEDAQPEGILVRSAAMHDMEMPKSLLAIARAGAGTNNIPVDKCAEEGIVVFNTPGANANAVKELVLGGLVLSSRGVVKGIEWAKTLKGQGEAVAKLVEKGKGQFVGPELAGKKLGVIGLGAIGVKVANMGVHLGMEVLGYDPYISIDAAWNLSRSVKHCINLSDIIAQCDYITVHMPMTADTKGFINEQSIAQMKHGVRILNFARGELVDTSSIISALKTGRVASYITDFPTDELLDVDGCICVPHLGASTPESEDNCAVMAADEISDYLLNGNITHSVNFPAVSMPRAAGCRVCIIHKNVPGILAVITESAGKAGLNIDNMVNKSKGNTAYTMLDATGSVPDDFAETISQHENVIRVRIV